MKKIAFIFSFFLLINCGDDDRINNCNFLINVGVNASLNLNLPEYSQLMFTSNTVYIANQGNAGIYVTNVGNDTYRAWDAADPNHVQNECSFLQRDGVEVTCSCADENKYNLFTGQALGVQLPCGLKEYRVTVSGSNIIVNN
ncbi:MAG: nitrite reductase/ring-hydroxylating ferredoxin subunit [Psychroserpens sp.]|jgi:nitrite reductase/ring-hydroxylating ferredoxin subunit